jgi:hypothetical protein
VGLDASPAKTDDRGFWAGQVITGRSWLFSVRYAHPHLADDWLASQYRKAAEVLDAQLLAGTPTSVGAQ